MKDDELNFDPGDIITVTGPSIHKDWWCGEINGKTGLFPVNYVQLQPEAAADSLTKQSSFLNRLYKSKKHVS